jgi:hypothetical protein
MDNLRFKNLVALNQVFRGPLMLLPQTASHPSQVNQSPLTEFIAISILSSSFTTSNFYFPP